MPRISADELQQISRSEVSDRIGRGKNQNPNYGFDVGSEVSTSKRSAIDKDWEEMFSRQARHSL